MTAFTRTPETNELIKLLKTIEVSRTITYQQMKEAIGLDLQQKRGRLTTAIKHCWDDHYYFSAVLGVGFYRMSSDEAAVYVKNSQQKKTRSLAKRVLNKTEAIDPAELKTAEALQAHAVALSVAHLQSSIVSRKAEKRLAAYAEESAAQIKKEAHDMKALLRGMVESGFTG